MESIDLYEIHDAAFVQRPECENCQWQRGEGLDAVCLKLEDMDHYDCPFVNAVLDDIHHMETKIYYRTLTVDFIDKVMDLELSKKENRELNTAGFAAFIFANKEVMKPKITEFFVKRITDLNNYRSVIDV